MHSLALFLFTQADVENAKHFFIAMLAILPVIIIVGLAIVIVPFWFICKKAGFSPWLSFIYLIPLGNLVLFYILAFSDWKVVPVAQLGYPPPPYTPQPPYSPPPQA